MLLAKLQELELCKLIYKIKNKETKTNINLNLKSYKHQYQTRRADNICIARIQTNKVTNLSRLQVLQRNTEKYTKLRKI